MKKIFFILTFFYCNNAFCQFGPPFINNAYLNNLAEWNDMANISKDETSIYLNKIKTEALKGANLNLSSYAINRPNCDNIVYNNICFKNSIKIIRINLYGNNSFEKAMLDAYFISNMENRRLAAQSFFNTFRDPAFFNSLGNIGIDFCDIFFGTEEIINYGYGFNNTFYIKINSLIDIKYHAT